MPPGHDNFESRLAVVENEIRHLTEFKEQAMDSLSKLGDEMGKDSQMLKAVHSKVMAIEDAPRRTVWWAEKLGAIALLALALYGAVKYGVDRSASAAGIPPEVVQAIADETAKRATEELVRRQSRDARQPEAASYHTNP